MLTRHKLAEEWLELDPSMHRESAAEDPCELQEHWGIQPVML